MISEFDVTQHVNTNHLIAVRGDFATCTCQVLATHYLAGNAREPWSTIGARYELKAARLSEGWRLTRLKWTRLWMSGNDGLWTEVGHRLARRAGQLDVSSQA